MKTKLLFLILSLVFCACSNQPDADDFVKLVVEASGGEDNLNAISDQVSTWDFKMVIPSSEEENTGQEMAMPLIITYKKPNKLRFDFIGPDGDIMQSSCFDGTTGWSLQMGNRLEKNEAQLTQDADMADNWIDGFLHYKNKGYTLELLPGETIDGITYTVIKATRKGPAMKYYIDPVTNLVARQAGDMVNFQNTLEPMYLTFAEHKIVDGIAVAHYVAQYTADNKMLWEANLKYVKHNSGISDEFFQYNSQNSY